jgi:hypothetical protein
MNSGTGQPIVRNARSIRCFAERIDDHAGHPVRFFRGPIIPAARGRKRYWQAVGLAWNPAHFAGYTSLETIPGQPSPTTWKYLYVYFYYQRDARQPVPDLDKKIRTLAAETAKAGTWVIPTLVVFRGIAEQIADLHAVLARPEVLYLPRSVGETFGWWPPNNIYVNRFDKETIPWFQTQYHLLERTTKAFQDGGVPLLAGTDTPTSAVVPGSSLHDELKALVTAGLTPYQALQTATVHAATFFGCSRTAGTIDVGKRADFVLLEQNPLNDISHLSAIAGVIVNGRWIPKSSLRSLLQNARKRQDKQ